MNIKSLSINGFKSFGKKTDFVFSKSITAIVGPNGSGKSNITEAMRFVLGEQSFKSIRTKEVTDLLFRGADSRASQLSVAITFDGTEKLVNAGESLLIKNALEKGEVEISRIVYGDGKNLYKINNQEVRLKDVQEILLTLSIGSKNSWHISQGESDKILLASPEQRREIVEDALGLRNYHAKINDSEKKLERAGVNIREATLKRKEIMPEIQMLGRQIEKIEKLKIYKQDLLIKWHQFSNFKIEYINKLQSELDKIGNKVEIEQKINQVAQQIVSQEKSHNETGARDVNILENKKSEEERLENIISQKLYTKEREKREIENLLSYIHLEIDKNTLEIKSILTDLNKLTLSGNEILFKEIDILSLKSKIDSIKSGSLNMSDFTVFLEDLSVSMNSLISKGMLVSKDNAKEISYLNNIKVRVEDKISAMAIEKEESENKLKNIIPEFDNLNLQIKIVRENIENLRLQILEFKFRGSEHERGIERLKTHIHDLHLEIEKINKISFDKKEEERRLLDEKYEVQKIFGIDFDLSSSASMDLKDFTNLEIHELERGIERLKIKIEDTQVQNADEISENYANLKERDIYLLNEIQDLEKSILNLNDLIKDLKDRLKIDFESGVNAVNNFFDIYVKKLFGGGMGRIYIQNNKKKKASPDNAESDDTDGLSEDLEQEKVGVEVEVELPKKKVKGLHALSGGERALVSIALTVAILQNNPSPFMILDEADATLDEANAKRYGELLGAIKEKTKLIVVTHNRETMSFADEVYGITLEKSGASKVLSVSFDDALNYAK